MTSKLSSVRKLLRSRVYILITDKEAIVETDFEGLSGLMQIQALEEASTSILNFLKELKGGLRNARKSNRGVKVSRKKQG